jgi:hypothetical protein
VGGETGQDRDIDKRQTRRTWKDGEHFGRITAIGFLKDSESDRRLAEALHPPLDTEALSEQHRLEQSDQRTVDTNGVWISALLRGVIHA